MPYVRRSGASQSNLLAAYIGAVRRKAGLSGYGMGQDDGSDDGALMPGEGPTVTPDSLPITMVGPLLPGQSATAYAAAEYVPPTSTATPTAATPASTASPDSLSGIFAALAQGAQSGLKIFQQAEGPTNIGGVLYNPATGQYYNPTTGQVVNASGTSSDVTAVTSLLSSPIILYGGLALVGVMVISMMGHK